MTAAPNDSSAALASPCVDASRIRSIDVMRGFALFGVLLMNMQVFADVFSGYMNPLSLGEISTSEFALWSFNYVVADTKFMTIFSMLFGAGIVLMTQRAKERTGKAAFLHCRRMFWLALFGFGHALLLWTGDILFSYAVVGMVAFLLRRVWLWLLFLLAAISFAVPALFYSFLDQMPAEDMRELKVMWEPSVEYIESTRAMFRGGWLGQVEHRYDEWFEMLGFLVFFGGRMLANMLIGMALFRMGVFAAERSDAAYKRMIGIGFVVGLPICAYGVYDHEVHDWDFVRSMGVGSLFNYVGSLIVAFGWIGIVMLICRRDALPSLRDRFAAVGQMAFTNYIMHSVICTTIFNGHGFGLFGSVDRIWQQLLVVAIFTAQLWFSPLWLRRFRFGPLEWVWRALSYWQLPVMRRTGA